MTSQQEQKRRLSSHAETRILMFWTLLKVFLKDIVQYVRYLWQHNPFYIISQRQRRLYFVENYGEVMIKPKMMERVLDVFLSDYRRRKRLLNWVHSKSRNTDVVDFFSSWQDGIALCALLESLCPGVCPSYHLLSHHNQVKNCRLGLKLANKYMYVPMDLISPEEMAIANKASENKIMQYISMLKWASENIKEKWSSLHESLIAAKSGKCFAKGSGLRNGIVGKRSKFTIIVSDTIGVFNMLVEVRGPNNEYCGERLVSLHQAKGVLDKSFDINSTYSDTIKYLEDGAEETQIRWLLWESSYQGNTFIRKKVPTRYVMNSSDVIHMDFQCGEEGTFYVTFVPRRAGMHAVAVKWQNHHVENSPFRIKVYKASNVSTKSLKGAQEKRVIYDSLSFTTIGGSSQDSLDNVDHRQELPEHEKEPHEHRSAAAIAKSKAYCKGRQLTVTRRRVLRRIITRNGEDIVIEEAISPSLSRQSSITDNSDDDNRNQRKDGRFSSAVSQCIQATSHPPNMTNHNAAVALGTVLEERQNSKDGTNKTTLTDKQSILDVSNKQPSLRNSDCKERHNQNKTSNDSYSTDRNGRKEMTSPEPTTSECKITELNEPRIQEISNGIAENDEEKHLSNGHVESEPKEVARSSNQATITPIKTTQKAPLQRTFSIHGYQKPVARRTTSDGPVYHLRRQLLSMGTSERSETDTDLSSDDKNSNTDENGGVSSPGLKVLHSSSFKKACMYISDRAFNYTMSSITDEDAHLNGHISEVASQVKTKLRATRSLPITRKMWETNTSENEQLSMNNDISYVKKSDRIPRVTGDGNDKNETVYYLEDNGVISCWGSVDNVITADEDGNVTMNQFVATKEGERHKNQAEIHTEMCNAQGFPISSAVSAPNSGNMTNMLNTNIESSSRKPLTEVSKSPKCDSESFEEAIKELENLTSPNSDKSGRQRSTKPISEYRRKLMRKWGIVGQCCSVDSLSDIEKRKALSGKSVDSFTGTGSEPKMKFDFQSINDMSNQEADPDSTKKVFIVIPKAKVDKSTQVSEAEIKRETGWDVVERIYLLLRKVSIIVPSNIVPSLHYESLFDIASPHNIELNDNATKFEGRVHYQVSQEHMQESGVKISEIKPETKTDENDGGEKDRKNGNGDNLLRVNTWLQNQGLDLNGAHLMSPVRQMTVETVDSGFDDSLTYNRQARFSLPSLRTLNGHVRLHRRPYRGQILLDRKLVVSSSQSMSVDRPEQGHEADDELIHNSSIEHNTRHQRRRHRLRDRKESFSMSDSEISQRRRTNKRRVFPNRRPPARDSACDNRTGNHEKKNILNDRNEEIPNLTQDRKIENNFPRMNDDDSTGIHESNNNEKANETGMIPTKTNDKKCPSSVLRNRSSTRSKSSSLDSNYFGFGISKHGRDSLLSQIGEFQNLCPTEEYPVEEDMVFENPFIYTGSDVTTKQGSDINHIFNGRNENDEEELGVMISLDGLIDANACETQERAGTNDTPETNRSVLESDSTSDELDPEPVNTGSDDVFDMFSSFDHSHMNDVLPKQDSLRSMNVEASGVPETDTSGSPTMVRVAGVGHRYGQVGTSNSFQVWIENPATGSLSVNVIGPRAHTVTETSVIYTGDNLYEISYEVTQPGFYKIYIRWGNVDIPQCPYICEVTL